MRGKNKRARAPPNTRPTTPAGPSLADNIRTGAAEIPGYYYDQERKKYFKLESQAAVPVTGPAHAYTRSSVRDCREQRALAAVDTQPKAARAAIRPPPAKSPARKPFRVPEVGLSFPPLPGSKLCRGPAPQRPLGRENGPLASNIATWLFGRQVAPGPPRSKSGRPELRLVRTLVISETLCPNVVSIAAVPRASAAIVGLSNGAVAAVSLPEKIDCAVERLAPQHVERLLNVGFMGMHPRPVVRACESRCGSFVRFGFSEFAFALEAPWRALRRERRGRRIEPDVRRVLFGSAEKPGVTFESTHAVGDLHCLGLGAGGARMVAIDGLLERGILGYWIQGDGTCLTDTLCGPLRSPGTPAQSAALSPDGAVVAIVHTMGAVWLHNLFSQRRARLNYPRRVAARAQPLHIRYFCWLKRHPFYALVVLADGGLGLLAMSPDRESQCFNGRWLRLYVGGAADVTRGRYLSYEQSFAVDAEEKWLFQVGVEDSVRVWPLFGSGTLEPSDNVLLVSPTRRITLAVPAQVVAPPGARNVAGPAAPLAALRRAKSIERRDPWKDALVSLDTVPRSRVSYDARAWFSSLLAEESGSESSGWSPGRSFMETLTGSITGSSSGSSVAGSPMPSEDFRDWPMTEHGRLKEGHAEEDNSSEDCAPMLIVSFGPVIQQYLLL